ETSMNMMGRSMKVNSTINTTQVVSVEDVNDGNYLLSSRVTHFASTTKNSLVGNTVTIDSDNPDDLKGKKGEVVKNLLDLNIKVTLSPKGEVLKVDMDTTKIDAKLIKSVVGKYGNKGYGTGLVFLALPNDLSV